VTAGPRTSEGRKDRLVLTGIVTGLAPGTVLTPYLKAGEGRAQRLRHARIVVNDSGEITWRRLVKSSVTVRVVLRAEGVASNAVSWKRIR
jgi:hypothetical protein